MESSVPVNDLGMESAINTLVREQHAYMASYSQHFGLLNQGLH